jgi:maltodextrin utilization protein YvdJ
MSRLYDRNGRREQGGMTTLYQQGCNHSATGERYSPTRAQQPHGAVPSTTMAGKNSFNSNNSVTRVGFCEPGYHEERKKYLTAKYGQHQMKLIRKRLQVEDWVDEQLNQLYRVVIIMIIFYDVFIMIKWINNFHIIIKYAFHLINRSKCN